ncbi:MAG: CusA/CzcA family heavy metal efflux RND transporter [Bacteroidia bacterium]|nr:CusA/CzcA family heavy metal efflux RND transporter [Bacteroidia bacterium]
MLNFIISFSIRNKLIIGLFTLALVLWGSYSLTQLPIDALPDITNNQVQIITTSPSLAAQEIERLITFPIEQAIANVSQTEEVRSMSRFGLSVVTVVFKDGVDIYWARAQISERLIAINKDIPQHLGQPTLAPVSSGLGEIYQYILKPKKGYEHKYTATDLRTLQDWVVRKQLLGIAGVADVSSFGGYLKQYEIAINPAQLRSYNISINQVFTALASNNANTGGAYIDKYPNAYFIRTEGMVQSLDDIGNTVVSVTNNKIPVLIKDIATVQYGAATRYGAMTYNNEGEVTGAVLMMLKGENSNAVVSRVKERMLQIQRTLPEGVEINTFLDRSKLVNRAISTVQTNLLEGALIVILVLILFLGNLRAGLIVASVIPLAMLFAVSMMNLFGVSGNLMSLGAVDFGLIIDGAVIIVEAILHHLSLRKLSTQLTQQQMDDEVYETSSKIRGAASFGEIIILIVYLPILALVGIEGKMFVPMAQTVSFAIIGAFILSLTYVPMVSSLFLSKTITTKKTLSDRMMLRIEAMYLPLLHYVLMHKSKVIATTVFIFIASIVLFTTLGGEFIPTLDEGDFAVETRVLTGSSMAKTIEVTQKAATLLLKNYPNEVKEVVAKIGSSEIPTDPMPIEACDLMIILKEKHEWTKANNGDALAELMTETLSAIPGVTFGFQQPIQMRFNELMTGARQDIAVKIFGDDLETLSALAKKIAKQAQKIEGVKDMYVEEVTGLPQIIININRKEVAKYGVSIATINEAVNTAFAGQVAGTVYEGEKRFDMVVRLEKQNRTNIDDVRYLFITTPTGMQVPLMQLADVSLKLGPNQIQREDKKRRIIVGFNVRGRDVETVVKELQQKISAKIKMPVGYYASYGGQFQNLQQAKARLGVAVPLALLLIVVLLFFAFNSIKHAALIFTSIPMSAIGGVLALWLRGMPFSISAGVGFIALFGVAVLNGIVLVAEFNRIKAQEQYNSLYDLVLRGTRTRLRPVLMTAAVASLGFIPMALSSSAGAEVQKPLATVVIGGLITSTLLTLLVLPCLYIMFENFKHKKKTIVTSTPVAIIIGLLMLMNNNDMQAQPLTLANAISTALANNKGLSIADINLKIAQLQAKQAFDLPKANVGLMYGQMNSYVKVDNNFSITQNIPYPLTMVAKKNLGNAYATSAQLSKQQFANELMLRVKQSYTQYQYTQALQSIAQEQDSIFEEFVRIAKVRYTAGDVNEMEYNNAQNQQQLIQSKVRKLAVQASVNVQQLHYLMEDKSSTNIITVTLIEEKLSTLLDTTALYNNAMLAVLKADIKTYEQLQKVVYTNLLPDITLGYFNQSLIGSGIDKSNTVLANNGNRFQGVQVGLTLPLLSFTQHSKVKASALAIQSAHTNYDKNENILRNQLSAATQEYLIHKENINYYEKSAKNHANKVVQQSNAQYKKGEIPYAEYLYNINNAFMIHENQLQTIYNINNAVYTIEYLTGK